MLTCVSAIWIVLLTFVCILIRLFTSYIYCSNDICVFRLTCVSAIWIVLLTFIRIMIEFFASNIYCSIDICVQVNLCLSYMDCSINICMYSGRVYFMLHLLYYKYLYVLWHGRLHRLYMCMYSGFNYKIYYSLYSYLHVFC